MAKLSLRRFSTFESYENADFGDGTFFIIVETEQLGVRKVNSEGEIKDILTPPKTLRGYESLPIGDAIITQNNTIYEALSLLEEKILNTFDEAEIAKNIAKNAKLTVDKLDYNGETINSNLASDIISLQEKHVVISEEEFDSKTGFDPGCIYYIYEND